MRNTVRHDESGDHVRRRSRDRAEGIKLRGPESASYTHALVTHRHVSHLRPVVRIPDIGLVLAGSGWPPYRE